MPSLNKQEHIYKSAHKSFFKMCVRYCGNVEVAKEIFNDGMLNYFKYEERNEVTDKGRFSLIKKILVNKCIDHLRTKKNEHQELDNSFLGEENEGQLNLMREEMFEVIKSFPKQTRLIFNLYIFEGWAP